MIWRRVHSSPGLVSPKAQAGAGGVVWKSTPKWLLSSIHPLFLPFLPDSQPDPWYDHQLFLSSISNPSVPYHLAGFVTWCQTDPGPLPLLGLTRFLRWCLCWAQFQMCVLTSVWILTTVNGSIQLLPFHSFLAFCSGEKTQIRSPSYPECESEIWSYLCLPCSSWKAGRIIGVIQHSGVLEQQAGALLSSVPPKIIASTSPNHLPPTHTHIHTHTFSTSGKSLCLFFGHAGGMQDLSSPTRDWTCAPCSGSTES